MGDIETSGVKSSNLQTILVSITPEQKILLARLSKITGQSQSALIRMALGMLIGGYQNALK